MNKNIFTAKLNRIRFCKSLLCFLIGIAGTASLRADVGVLSTVIGPGLEGAKHGVGLTTTLIITGKDTLGNPIPFGGAPFVVSIESPGRQAVPFTFVDNSDGTYTVSYVVTRPGAWWVSVKLNGSDITGSPARPVFTP